MPDLPALIGFHRGWTAHRAETTHFILGLHWMVIPAVPVNLQLRGYNKIQKTFLLGADILQKFLLASQNKVKVSKKNTLRVGELGR